jgi:thiamine transporter
MFNEWKDALKSNSLQDIISSSFGQILIMVIALVLLLSILVVSGSKKSGKLKVKELTYTAIAMAIAIALSYVKIIKLPQGGSVTLFSMLFIVLIGYWFGLRQGLLAGFAYGLLQLIIDPYAVHPLQVLLDYPLAFAGLGLAGIFKNSEHGLLKGLIAGALGRFLFSFISGVVYYGSYAPEGFDAVTYSVAYNISYIGIEIFLTMIILLIPVFDSAMKLIKKNAINS